MIGTTLVVSLIGLGGGVWLALMRAETRHDSFIDESVGAKLSEQIRVLSSADEADHGFAQLGWAAYYFEFNESSREQVAQQLRIESQGALPYRLSDCHWEDFPSWRRPPDGPHLSWGHFEGSNGNDIIGILDMAEPRGWLCIGYGDRAFGGQPTYDVPGISSSP